MLTWAWLQALDEDLFLGLHRLLHDLLPAEAVRFANELGSGYVAVPIVLALAVSVRRKRLRLTIAAHVVLAMTLAGAATYRLKHAVDRARPHSALRETFEKGDAAVEFDDARGGQSMPSGHTATAFAWALALFQWARSLRGWRRRFARVSLLVPAVSVGLTRIYIGVHFPLDVLAGALVGWLSALLVGALVAPLALARRPDAMPEPATRAS